MRPFLNAVVLALVVGLAAGCTSGPDEGERTVLHVFAASSLTGTFSTLAARFEKDHPDVRVVLNFGPSSGLGRQIDGGAPADVFASASPADMARTAEEGHATGPEDFAVNTMAIAVPPDNPAGIAALADLGETDVTVALCQEQVPCGRVAAEVLGNADLDVRPATEEVDVRSVLTKVRLGEVDAGMVYVTDVRAAAGAVKGITIPADVNASTTYQIAPLTHSDHPDDARSFVALVLSDPGRAVLAEAGFGEP